MKLKCEYIVQEVADSFVAVPIIDCNKDKSELIRLNDCGRFIFECLQQEMNEDQILNCMAAEYDAPFSELRDGLSQFLSQLKLNNVLID